ncbi:MAG: hypothetical protein U9N49_01545 [Campylobacterota bacterium]|nr:hypothetical protein [Campylobacterota bacterium]
MQIIIDNPSLEAQLIAKSKELKIKVDELIERLLADKIKEEEFYIDSKYAQQALDNIKHHNASEFQKISPNDLIKQIGI